MPGRRFVPRLKIAAIVSVSTLLAIALTLAIRWGISESVFAPDTDILGNYLQVIGAVYAFVVGFVIFVVWSQYTRTEEVMDQEVGRLKAMWGAAGDLQPGIAAYAAAVVREIESGIDHRKIVGAAESEWQELTRAIRDRHAEDPRELALYGDLLRQLGELAAIRNARLSITGSRIPWVLWDLIVMVTLVTLLPFCCLRVKSLFVDLAMVASMASSLTFILVLIADLDDPFRGVFNVSLARYRELK
jgi:hypothetical protein